MSINIREVSRVNVTIHMLYSSTSSETGRKKKKESKRERKRTMPVREVRAAQDGGWAGAARSSDEDEF